jgi:hypothetical protein
MIIIYLSLPYSLYESGIILGSIILVTTCFMSIVACTFIIESLAIQNGILKEEKNVIKISALERQSKLSDDEISNSKYYLVLFNLKIKINFKQAI